MLSIHAALDLIEKDLAGYAKTFRGSSIETLSFIKISDQPWRENIRSSQRQIRYLIDYDKGPATLHRFEGDALIEGTSITSILLEAPQISFAYLDDNLSDRPLWALKEKQAPSAIVVQIKDSRNATWRRIIPLPVRAL